MTSIAVVAHARKQLGDGLPALRRLLERRGFDTPIWHEVQKSKQAPKRVEKALAAGAQLMRPIFDIPGVGRIAILREPGGAGIAWMTPTT